MLPPAPQGRAPGVWRHALSLAGPARARGECSERRCVPPLRRHSPRCPLRGAQRSAGTVAMGVHRGTRQGRGRSRAAAAQPAGTGAGAERTAPHRRPVTPYCVTATTPSLWDGCGGGTAARPAQFRPGSLRPLVLQGKVRYDGIHSSTFPRYSAGGLSASGRRPPRTSSSPLSGTGAPRRRRYVDGSARSVQARPPGRPLRPPLPC